MKENEITSLLAPLPDTLLNKIFLFRSSEKGFLVSVIVEIIVSKCYSIWPQIFLHILCLGQALQTDVITY